MDAAMTLYAVVQRARLSLTAAGVESSGADAAELAAFALGVDASELARRMILREEADTGFVERFEGLVEERAARIPLQHLTGRAYFRGLTLAVGPGVFVPRPETESVAQLAIDVARSVGQAPVVVDLCTGSGAIALAIKDELPLASVYAVELSEQAFAWAVANRDRLALDVDLRLGDAVAAFDDLAGQAARAAVLLRSGGVLVMEHAVSQGDSLPAQLRQTGAWRNIADHADLTGRPRTTVARRR